ncbi:HlyD family secretion protein [Chelativorans salis]|uniref:HlyD family secretion protein n=1 Tax=Chelativorans salis TaxID=2978478 RepID=A0ABT2LTL0_9HYPH|nr:HlyD family secretion protein [Chelativorans sp. EGI FJ00035]MCT7377855.1 HlyD family secretion protein [Chelativorans sp. EGI FJ00035]
MTNGNEYPRPTEKSARGETASIRHRRLLPAVSGVVAVGLIVAGAGYWFLTRNQETTDDAFVAADVVQIAPRVAGTVRAIHINDNQRVSAGDLLIELDSRDYASALAQAKSALNAAKANEEVARRALEFTQQTTAADLEQAKAGVALSEAAAKEAEEKVAASRAAANYDNVKAGRYGTLAADTFASRDQFDQAKAALASAEAELKANQQAVVVTQAQLVQARSQLDAANAAAKQVAEKRAQLDAAVANVASAAAALHTAEINLSYTKIRAPSDGFVTGRSVNPGDAVEPSQTLSLLVTGRPWVVANFKETQLERMRPGQPVDVGVDAYPGTVLHGHVDSIQHGSGAAFSLLPPENATGNYVKVVQRVPVKIVIDDPIDSTMVLGPGMSVEPTVDVGAAPSNLGEQARP